KIKEIEDRKNREIEFHNKNDNNNISGKCAKNDNITNTNTTTNNTTTNNITNNNINIKDILFKNNYTLPSSVIDNLHYADNDINDYISNIKYYKKLYMEYYKDNFYNSNIIPLYEDNINNKDKCNNNYTNTTTNNHINHIDINSKLRIPSYVYSHLYSYQISCISFLYSLYLSNEGGIVADDMGIGKTIQIIGYITGLFYSGISNSVIIVVPSTLLKQWYMEFKRFSPFVRVLVLHNSYFKNKYKSVESSIKEIFKNVECTESEYNEYYNIIYNNNSDGDNNGSNNDDKRDNGGIDGNNNNNRITNHGNNHTYTTNHTVNTTTHSKNRTTKNNIIPYVMLISYDYFLKPYIFRIRLFNSDFLFADEAHKLKNCDTAISKRIKNYNANNKIIITGTPLQNRLKELHTLFDIVCPDKLGTYTRFYEEFEASITESVKKRKRRCNNDEDYNDKGYNSYSDKGYNDGSNITNTYNNNTNKYTTNTNTTTNTTNNSNDKIILLKSIINKNIIRRSKSMLDIRILPNKQERIIFCKLSTYQQQLYDNCVTNINNNIKDNSNFIAEIDRLRKIVNHPFIYQNINIKEYFNKYNNDNEKDGNGSNNDDNSYNGYNGYNDDNSNNKDSNDNHTTNINHITTDINHSTDINNKVLFISSKLNILFSLIDSLVNDNKILIFSQSLRMLDIIEYMIIRIYGKDTYLRIDGKTNIKDRSKILSLFSNDNNDDSGDSGIDSNNHNDIKHTKNKILLLTTKVGGVGLNITAANTLIIYDPDWNPSTDNQAMQRIYRIGQNKDVKIYRLITKDTIEEIIYESQLFKQLLTKTVLKDKIYKSIINKHNDNKNDTNKSVNRDVGSKNDSNITTTNNITTAKNNKTIDLLFIKDEKKLKDMEYYQSKIKLTGKELLRFIYLREDII
ncbi:putative DNA repair and recombination protein RAD26, partial [Spraguea lophii 42_110]